MSGKQAAKNNERAICRNRRAHHEYELLERVEAGLVLLGTEVKSLRNGKASIEEAYARVQDGEVWLVGSDIPVYPQAHRQNHEPKRRRKLLLHKREIARVVGSVAERGLTLVPLKLYFRRGKAKVELAVARGRKFRDKREELKKQTARREIERAMRGRR
ncbi:MAG: SsrA-binding protein SmpB [Planctomycetes bacterium]|nr:SsrA-binding protein SmpB [Planctomycetota bacterium]